MYKKILLLIVATISTAIACKTNNDCPADSLCIRGSYCLNSDQLKYIAETYAPIEAVAKVAATQVRPECTLAYECDDGFDRCSKGACLSDQRAAAYRQQVQQVFIDNFGNVEISKLPEMKCVSNVHCVAGDICYQGKCQGYEEATQLINQRHEEYKTKKLATAADKQ